MTMHIPDGFLDPITVTFTYGLFLIIVAIALRRVSEKIDPNIISTMTVTSAGIFVAQMLNWTIPGGTSLHFAGGALAAILLGPWLGVLSMTIVLLVQCLVFHDGGITALGANVLNMGIINVFVGYIIYRTVIKLLGVKSSSRTIGAILSGWAGITLAGIACGFEIGFSPQFPYGWQISVPVMGIWHAILGIIEGIITAIIITYIGKKNSELILAERGV